MGGFLLPSVLVPLASPPERQLRVTAQRRADGSRMRGELSSRRPGPSVRWLCPTETTGNGVPSHGRPVSTQALAVGNRRVLPHVRSLDGERRRWTRSGLADVPRRPAVPREHVGAGRDRALRTPASGRETRVQCPSLGPRPTSLSLTGNRRKSVSEEAAVGASGYQTGDAAASWDGQAGANQVVRFFSGLQSLSNLAFQMLFHAPHKYPFS